MLLFAALLSRRTAPYYTSHEASDERRRDPGGHALVLPASPSASGPVLEAEAGGKLYVAVSGRPRGGPGQRDEEPAASRFGRRRNRRWSISRSKGGRAASGGARSRVVDLSPAGKLLLRLQRRRRTLTWSTSRPAALGAHGVRSAPSPRVSRSLRTGGRSTSPARGGRVTVDRREAHPAGPAGGRRLWPRAVAFTPDGARAFVSASRVQRSSDSTRATSPPDRPHSIRRQGRQAHGLAMSGDGSRLFVSTGRGGRVSVDVKPARVPDLPTGWVAAVGGGVSPAGDACTRPMDFRTTSPSIDLQSGRI